MLPDKILFINCTYLDYLQDVVFSGLYKILGERITEYPHNNRLYVDTSYPQNLPYVDKANRSAKLLNLLDDWDLIIVGACKKEPLKIYRKLLSLSPKARRTPSVLIDGGDAAEIGGDARKEFSRINDIRPFDMIFKREMTSETIDNRVFSLSFGINPDNFPIKNKCEKNFNLFYVCRMTHQIREEAFRALENRIPDSNIHLDNPQYRHRKTRQLFRSVLPHLRKSVYQRFDMLKIPPDKYIDYLAKSRIGISMPGAGFDTFRYWEIPAARTVLLSLRPTIYIRNNFKHDESAIFVDSPSELLSTVKGLLKEKNRLEDLTNNALDHLYKYHTDRNRAEYILNIVDGRKF